MGTQSFRFSRWVVTHSGAVVLLALLISAALAVPFLTMEPEGSASQEPEGEIFDARDLANERFAAPGYDIPMIVEARGGDMLLREPLLELYENSEALRNDPEVGPKLYSYFDRRFGVEVEGLYTLADAIDDALRAQGIDGLEDADDDDVKAVGTEIIDAAGPVRLFLSGDSARDPDTGEWVVPAFAFGRRVGDDEAVGGPPAGTVLGVDDTTKEEFNREVERVVRGDEDHYELWGVALDVNLTSAEQGEAAGPFIGFTVLAVLLVVGLVYRSYWPVAISGGALALMIVWLRGIANLVGMEQDQILALIVPIAMISFGIDFAFHSFGRYAEERTKGERPRGALTVGLAGVLGALVLALASDTAAFLSNTAAGIQSIVQFGFAASFGLLSAFVMLGVVAPLVLMRIDERVGEAPKGWGTRIVSVTGALLAAGMAMAAVLLSVFIAPPVGVAMIAVYLVLFLLLPALVAGRRGRRSSATATQAPKGPSRASMLAGNGVARVARHRRVVVPAVVAVTAVCAYFAVQVPAQFDVEDFFNPSSRFVVGLDKLDEHGGEGAGEPAIVYVEGDLTDPAAVEAMSRFRDDVRSLDTPALARADDGGVRMSPNVIDVLEDVAADSEASAAVAEETGVRITDNDRDGYPDRQAQVAAVFSTALENDLPVEDGQAVLAADEVGTMLWQSDDGDRQAAKFEVFVAGSREQETIALAQEEMQPLIDDFEAELQAVASDARVVLTGPPIERQASFDAINRALRVSLPIAIVICLILTAVVMRSLRYAVVTIIPIILVVAWLYAFMYAFGFNVNIVTATIGAISIGIGIDYAIHFVMRYREEMVGARSRDEALRASGASTGMALVGSALSSVVGFAILALAPMPLFASYGLLTAVMIVMALAASLLVLPSMVAMVTPGPVDQPPEGRSSREPATETSA